MTFAGHLKNRYIQSTLLSWAIQVRAWSFFGQLLYIAYAVYSNEVQNELVLLPAAVFLLVLITQIIALRCVKTRVDALQRWLPYLLLLDCLFHTALLLTAGGAANPFSVLFLMQIVPSAVLLTPFWTAIILTWSILCFGSLFFFTSSQHAHHHSFAGHLYGMWAAYVYAAVLTSVAVSRLMMLLRSQQRSIERLQKIEAAQARLGSLVTLTAGAAHELATPLGTISIVSGELRHRLQSLQPELLPELDVVRQEVQRCKAVLQQMASSGEGVFLSESVKVSTAELTGLITDIIRPYPNVRLDNRLTCSHLYLNQQATASVLLALITNALQASTADAPIDLRLQNDETYWRCLVTDTGCGIPAHALEQVTDPFFTTKPEGSGMGLGLFLVASYIHSQQGKFQIESEAGCGTTVIVSLPIRQPFALTA